MRRSRGHVMARIRDILASMNCRRAFQFTLAWCMLAALTAHLCSETAVAQTPAKKAPSANSKPDTWQKSKECADQAAKVINDWDDASVFWQNHYSPKYNQCFLLISRQIELKDWIGPVLKDTLYDAFERSALATSIASPVPPQVAALCSTDDDPKADCKTAADFITEHLKN
jgi:hypothetical protein